MRRPLNWAAILSGLLACYWLTLFIGTHYPKPPRFGGGHADKYLHFGAFAVLACLICAVSRIRQPLRLGFYIKLLLMLAAYGAIDELSQTLVGRDCELGDWLADIGGAACTCLIFAAATYVLSRKPIVEPYRTGTRLKPSEQWPLTTAN